MTEPTTTTQPSIREMRHEIRNLAGGVSGLVSGTTGLSKDDQVARLDKTIEIIDNMRLIATKARETALFRDFDLYQQEKAAKNASFDSTMSGILAAEQNEDDQED